MNNISIIAAIGSNYELGKDNQLLWHISDDMKRFKKLTSGHPVIMGRKTFESFKNGPLTNRRNIVLTNNLHFNPTGVEVVHNVDKLFEILDMETESFIIGGETIYRLFLPLAYRMYLTLIDRSYDADAFFPQFNINEWKEIEHVDISDDIQAEVKYSFITFERISIKY
jgi:dihydrofolate reductase